MTDTPLSHGDRLFYFALAALFAVAFLVFAFTPLHAMLSATATSPISEVNTAFLEAGRRTALKDMVFLTEILGVVEIVRTTEVGFSFLVTANVEVGQGVAALAVVLERAMLAAVAGATVYQALDSLISLSGHLAGVLAQGALIFGAIYFLIVGLGVSASVRASCRHLFEFVAVLFLFVQLALPYSIYATQWVSARVTAEIAQDVSGQLQAVHGDVTSTTGQPTEMEPWTKEAFVRQNFERVRGNLNNSVDTMSRYVVQRLAVNAIEGVIVPLLLLLAIWLFLVRLMRVVLPQQTSA